MKNKSIIRKPLLTAFVHSESVERVEIKEINFTPRQKTGLHTHPCPVVGYIVKGTVLFQVEGQPAQILHAGDAFYEPANTRMIHFDNHSDSEDMTFIAFYLLQSDDHEVIHIIDTQKN